MDVIQEVEMSNEERTKETEGGDVGDDDRNQTHRPPPVQVAGDVKINVGPATPTILLSSNVTVSRAELRKAEEKMTIAFMEFHERLRLLKNYW